MSTAPRRRPATQKKGRVRRGRPRLRVAGPPRSRRLVFLVAAFLVVGALVVGVVSIQALVAQTSFRMQELARRNAELTRAGGQLQLEIAELSSPKRIAKEARRLGYRLPDPDELHTIAVSGSAPAREWNIGTGGLTGPRP